MLYRLRVLVFSAALAICIAPAGFRQSAEMEDFVIKPGQAVYVVAVKGECDQSASTLVVNGRVMAIPGGRAQAGAERKTLSYTEPFPQAATIISQAFAKNKTFVVVDSIETADFVFRVCAAYTENLLPLEEIRQMHTPSRLAFADARVVPASVFRADQEAIFNPLWKAITPDAQRPVPGSKAEGKKKKEKNAPPSPQGVVIINGVSVGPNSLPDLPELEDLPKYFWQDYPKFAPIKIPKAKIAVVSAEEIQRPVLTNKPDEAPVETTRPTLRNQPGEARTTAKTAVEKTTSETEETIKVDTALISVPVRVLDKDSKYVPDLTKKDFKVFEGGTEQEIENFSAVEEPFHVVLLLDMSGSTHFKAEEIQDAALAFIEQLRPQDRVLVASFESAVYVDADFTNDRARLTKAILRTRSGGSTRLYDAVDLALTERLNRIQGRKAIVLFSDGVDTASKGATMVGNLSKIEESNALVYSIRYDTLPDMAPLIQNNRISPVPPQTGVSVRGMNVKEMYERAKMYMNELATRSGGRSYEATTLTDAKTAFANIAEELRRQYWLSYYSSNPKSDGSYRNIRVTVQQAEVKRWAVRAKNGYRAPKK